MPSHRSWSERASSLLRLHERGEARSWVVCAVAGGAAYAASTQGLFVAAAGFQVPLFVGFVVGLISLVPWQGACVALVTVLGGMLVAPPLMPSAGTVGGAEYALALVLAPLAGALPSVLRDLAGGRARRALTLGMSALLVAWVLVGFWTPLVADGFPPRGYGLLTAQSVRAPALPGHYDDDEGLYRRIFALVHEGESYYPAFRSAWLGIASKPTPPSSPLGIRLPTFFWMWRLLPPDPFSAVVLFLAFASVGIVASAFIAGQLVGPRLAPLAALALAAYALDAGFSSYALFVDLPAMSVALVGVGLLAVSARKRSTWPLWTAAAVLAAAALMREILAYLILFAAASALLEPKGERLRRAAPMLAALGTFALGYAWHAVASAPYLGVASSSVTYFNGGWAYFADAFERFTGSYAGGGVALTLLVALGIAGALGAHRRTGLAFAAFAAASIVVPFASMLVLGNPSHDVRGAANYWGLLVIPLALALWPAAALLIAPPGPKAERVVR